MYLISGCLLGENCKYNGGNNFSQNVVDFCQEHSYMAVCPEMMGGLPSPRPPAERLDGRIVDKEGSDLTMPFREGAKRCLEAAVQEAEERSESIEGAILQVRSPSCGSGKIYDGTFSGVLIDGDGCFTELLKKQGINVISEKEIYDDKF